MKPCRTQGCAGNPKAEDAVLGYCPSCSDSKHRIYPVRLGVRSLEDLGARLYQLSCGTWADETTYWNVCREIGDWLDDRAQDPERFLTAAGFDEEEQLKMRRRGNDSTKARTA